SEGRGGAAHARGSRSVTPCAPEPTSDMGCPKRTCSSRADAPSRQPENGRYPRPISVSPVEYEVQVESRAGKARAHRYASSEPLRPGSVVRLDDREWLLAGGAAGGA